MHDLPPYLADSPAGLHVLDFQAFEQSSYAAPTSSDPTRLGWTRNIAALRNAFPPTPIGTMTCSLLVYNKSRDTDRICPTCRRWYHVGEAPGKAFASLEEFTQRVAPETPPDLLQDEIACEQDISGICSRVCFAVLNSGDVGEFGLDIDQVTPEQVSRHSVGVGRSSGCYMRKTTAAEEASMGGVKLVYSKWMT